MDDVVAEEGAESAYVNLYPVARIARRFVTPHLVDQRLYRHRVGWMQRQARQQDALSPARHASRPPVECDLERPEKRHSDRWHVPSDSSTG